MKKQITLLALLATSSLAVAQGGFHDPNTPKAGKHGHEMKHAHKGKQHAHHGGFFDESRAVKNVSAIKDAADNALVVMTGNIIKQVGKDEFIFKDDSGEVEIEVSHRAWQGQTITPNDTVEIRGKIDKEWDKTDVEVKQIIKK